MTAQLADLARAVWKTAELIEALTPEDLADLSAAPILRQLEISVEDFRERIAAAELLFGGGRSNASPAPEAFGGGRS